MIGMAFETWVTHPRHPWRRFEELGDLHGIGIVTLHTDGQGRHTAHDLPSIERTNTRPHVFDHKLANHVDQALFAKYCATEGITVTVDIFRNANARPNPPPTPADSEWSIPTTCYLPTTTLHGHERWRQSPQYR
jgi:hypothetical protein